MPYEFCDKTLPCRMSPSAETKSTEASITTTARRRMHLPTKKWGQFTKKGFSCEKLGAHYRHHYIIIFIIIYNLRAMTTASVRACCRTVRLLQLFGSALITRPSHRPATHVMTLLIRQSSLAYYVLRTFAV